MVKYNEPLTTPMDEIIEGKSGVSCQLAGLGKLLSLFILMLFGHPCYFMWLTSEEALQPPATNDRSTED